MTEPTKADRSDTSDDGTQLDTAYGKQPDAAEQDGGDDREPPDAMEVIPDRRERERRLPDGGTSTRPPPVNNPADATLPGGGTDQGENLGVEQYATGGGWYDLTPIGGQRVQGKNAAEAEFTRLGPTQQLR